MQNLMDDIKNNTQPGRKPDEIESLIIYGGPVYDGRGNLYEQGAVFIENDRISLIGEEQEVFGKMQEAMQNIEILNADGKLVSPGLINAHHHVHMAFATALTPLGPTGTFGERLENFIWPYEKSLSKEALQLSTLLTLIDSIKYGVTTIFVHHSSPSAIEDSLKIISGAFKRAGMRGLISYSLTDQFGEDRFREAILESTEFVSEHRMTSLIEAVPGLHANFTISDASLEAFIDNFGTDKGLHIHLGEAEEDLKFCQNKGYEGCVDRLDKFDLINENTILAHANHLSKRDIEIIKNKQPALIHNPVSNANSQAGWFELARANDTITGMGTDGLGSNILGDLNRAKLLHNIYGQQQAGLDQTLVKLLFENNAKIASRHFDLKIGTLEEGNRADVVIFDYEPNTLIHSNNVNMHLINGIKDSAASTVIANGKVIYKDKVFLSIDKEIVKKEARDLCKDVWEKYVKQGGNLNNNPSA